MKTAIFDLDGTLVDTSRDMLGGTNTVFEEMGLGRPLIEGEHDAIAFAGARAMLKKGGEITGHSWSEAGFEEAYQAFLVAYAAQVDHFSAIYPGVEEALDRLDAKGWKLAICTNKPSGLAETLLGSLGLRSRFGAMIGADTLSVRKPDPEPLFEAVRRVEGDFERSVLIGDTITDRKAALNAGMPCVLVTFGPLGQAVRDMEPDGLLGAYAEIETVLERFL